ncbi:hypothetical protein AB4865_11905 [Capnocytophaga sp. ARDL2]|uniref:hypothetical protein n=1 Tax=Capnocytophaga sp. ARDL2 TaxID=3238809 RepID=UPI003555FBDF
MTLVSTSALTVSCGKDDKPVKVDDTPQPSKHKLKIEVSATEAQVNTNVTVTATLEGVDVTSSTTFLVNDEPISGNTFTSATAGKVTVKAKREGALDSEYVEVEFFVNPFEDISGSGTITHDGVTANISNGLIRIAGYYQNPDSETGYEAWWWQFFFEGNNPNESSNLVLYTFDTDVVIENAEVNEQGRVIAGNITSLTFPGENQNRLYSTRALFINDENKGGQPSSGTVTYNTFDGVGTSILTVNTVANITGSVDYVVNYSGQILNDFQSFQSKGKVTIKSQAQKAKEMKNLDAYLKSIKK